MARMVYHDATGPIEVKPSDKSVWICACGLTRDKPYCDGSHSKARKEEAGKLYEYNKDRTDVGKVTDA